MHAASLVTTSSGVYQSETVCSAVGQLNAHFTSMINSLYVRCSNHSSGCIWQGTLAFLENHRRICDKHKPARELPASGSLISPVLQVHPSLHNGNGVCDTNSESALSAAAQAAIVQTISDAASSAHVKVV